MGGQINPSALEQLMQQKADLRTYKRKKQEKKEKKPEKYKMTFSGGVVYVDEWQGFSTTIDTKYIKPPAAWMRRGFFTTLPVASSPVKPDLPKKERNLGKWNV